MKKISLLLLVIVVVGLLPVVMISGSANAATRPIAYYTQTPAAFSNAAFYRIWQRTDKQISDGAPVGRSWVWGPVHTPGFHEPYIESPNGARLVQYFEKARMEINNPYDMDTHNPYYATNGLLVNEMVRGKIQIGNNGYEPRPASQSPVAGDGPATNVNAPTYATFQSIYDTGTTDHTGSLAIQTIDKAGNIGIDNSKTSIPNINLVYYDNVTGHNIPKVLFDFMTAQGTVLNNGQPSRDTIVSWIIAFGRPRTEAFWSTVKLGGVDTPVLMQLFERRSLTFTPSNPAQFQVEMGNVGSHYVDWRYGSIGGVHDTQRPDQPLVGPHIGYGFNVQLFYQDKNKVLDKAEAAGFNWIKQQVSWKNIENADGTYDWSELDNVVGSAFDRNFHIILSVVQSPARYGVNSTSANGNYGLPTYANRGAFSALMSAMALRYKNKVDAYEIWNEANLGNESGTPVDPQLYASILSSGSSAVKSSDKFAFTILGGLSPTVAMFDGAKDDVYYLDQLYKDLVPMWKSDVHGIGYAFDVVGVHANETTCPPTATDVSQCPKDAFNHGTSASELYNRIDALHNVMIKYGDSNKQIWLTEFGWDSQSNPPTGYEYAAKNSEQQQADYLVGAFQVSKTNQPWMGVMNVWNLNMAITNGGEQVGWGVLRPDYSNRPAYDALAAMAKP